MYTSPALFVDLLLQVPQSQINSHQNTNNIMYGRKAVQDENAFSAAQKGRRFARVPLGSKELRKPLLQKSQSSLNTFDRPTKPQLAKSNLVLGVTELKERGEDYHSRPKNAPFNLGSKNESRHKETIDLIAQNRGPTQHNVGNDTPVSHSRGQQLSKASLAPEASASQYTDTLIKPNHPPRPPLETTLRDTITPRTQQLHAVNVIDRDLQRSNVDPVKKSIKTRPAITVPQELIDDETSVETIPQRPKEKYIPPDFRELYDIPGGPSGYVPGVVGAMEDIDLDDPENFGFEENTECEQIGMTVDDLNDLLDM